MAQQTQQVASYEWLIFKVVINNCLGKDNLQMLILAKGTLAKDGGETQQDRLVRDVETHFHNCSQLSNFLFVPGPSWLVAFPPGYS